MSAYKRGPMVDDGSVHKVKLRPSREVEIWKGEPPQSTEGKIAIVFQLTNEKCGLTDEDKTGKKFKCIQKLLVQRVKNERLERDESGFGGQLIYDEKDVRQYKYCPTHGPDPAGPDHW